VAGSATGADGHIALVSWLDQIADDSGIISGETTTDGDEEEQPATTAEAGALWSYPDEFLLKGIYPLDPVALDEFGAPAYCRSCNRPGCGPMGCGPCGGGCLQPTWFVGADFVYLDRDTAREANLSGYNRVIVVNNVPVPIPTKRMTTQNVGFGFEPGLRFTVGRYMGVDFLKRVHSLEFSYFGQFHYSGGAHVTGQTVTQFNILGQPLFSIGDLFSFFPQSTSGFTGANFQSATYSSKMNSFELNWRVRRPLGRDSLVAKPDNSWWRRCTTGATPSFLLGVRYLSIPEEFGFFSQGPRIFYDGTGQPVESSTASGSYLIRSTNDMFGFQVGGDLVQQFSRFNVGFRGKAGLYSNWVTQSSVVSASEDPLFAVNPSRAFGAQGQHAAFVGEIGFNGTYHLRQNFDLKLGYDFMWVARIANAPLQIQRQIGSEPRVNINGGTLFQGLSAGVELFW
jgi:hypothetical protein